MEFNHTSVLLEESIKGLNINPKGIYVDGTLGGAGHSYEICKHLDTNGILIGIDRDKDAIEASSKKLDEFPCSKILENKNYCEVKKITEKHHIAKINGAILDLGVSSFQLDNKERGFSYMQNAPLDMRMNQEDELTAFHVVNHYSESEIFRIIKDYGEERWASRIAKFIVNERKIKPLETTEGLVTVIKKAIPLKVRKDGPHPAKRTFQAIRIEVNSELSKIKQTLIDIFDILETQGRLCVITFHSLEDRIVKEEFKELSKGCICPKELYVCVCSNKPKVKIVTRKPIIPSDNEIKENSRSRSAKLRICYKI